MCILRSKQTYMATHVHITVRVHCAVNKHVLAFVMKAPDLNDR